MNHLPLLVQLHFLLPLLHWFANLWPTLTRPRYARFDDLLSAADLLALIDESFLEPAAPRPADLFNRPGGVRAALDYYEDRDRQLAAALASRSSHQLPASLLLDPLDAATDADLIPFPDRFLRRRSDCAPASTRLRAATTSHPHDLGPSHPRAAASTDPHALAAPRPYDLGPITFSRTLTDLCRREAGLPPIQFGDSADPAAIDHAIFTDCFYRFFAAQPTPHPPTATTHTRIRAFFRHLRQHHTTSSHHTHAPATSRCATGAHALNPNSSFPRTNRAALLNPLPLNSPYHATHADARRAFAPFAAQASALFKSSPLRSRSERGAPCRRETGAACAPAHSLPRPPPSPQPTTAPVAHLIPV